MTESQAVSEKKEEQISIHPQRCPLCGVETVVAECIVDGKTEERSIWYFCQCGIVFQSEYPTSIKYDEKYIVSLAEGKQAKDRYEYLARLYAPLIEDLTYGRMMLEVGYCVPFLLKHMEERGWLTWAIDVNPTLTGKGNLYNGDFVKYDFSITAPDLKDVTGEEKIDRKFDLIWMGHVIEHMENPIAALDKAYNLLDEKGLLFISTPDIEFIYKTGVVHWPHFKKNEHYILWSERSLKRELERLGFKVIMCRRNFSSRFMSWYDLHIIAQRNYF